MSKLVGLLKSRKFWSLVTAVIAAYSAYALGDIEYAEAVKFVVAALMTYIGATALEDGLRGRTP